MKVKVTQELCDLDGKAIPVGHDLRDAMAQVRGMLEDPAKLNDAKALVESLIGNTVPMTFRKAALNALLASLKGDDTMDGEKKASLWALAGKINKDEVVDIDTGKECELLKDRIGKAYGPMVVGPCFAILNADQGTK